MLHQLLQQYEDQIAHTWADCGEIEGIFLKLDLKPGSRPFKRMPYRQSFLMMKEIDEQIKRLLDAGFIEVSNSEYASPITMVPKKGAGGKMEWRMCIDYRLLNSITVKGHYPIPNIRHMYQRFHGNRYFSALDVRHGYHHIRIRPEDRHKTAFICHRGLFQWTRMAFGFVMLLLPFSVLWIIYFAICTM